MDFFYSLVQIANLRRKNDTFGSVCRSILDNLNRFKTYSIMEMADICMVSNSTVSRLAAILDYRNFSSMATQLYDLKDDYIAGGSILPETGSVKKAPAQAFELMREAITQAEERISAEEIRQCIDYYQSSRRVVFCGYPFPQGLEALQMELATQGIATCAYLSAKDQYEILHSVTDEDTVFMVDCYLHKTIFSALLENYNGKGKLIILSCSDARKRSVQADIFLSFPDRNFSMNMFSAAAVLYAMTAALQAAVLPHRR